MERLQEILNSKKTNTIISEWIKFTEILVITGLSMYLSYFYPSVYTSIFSLVNSTVLYVFTFLKVNTLLFWVFNKNVRGSLIYLLSLSLTYAIFYFIIKKIIMDIVILNVNFLEKVFNS